MAVTAVRELGSGRTGSDSNSLDRSYKRVFEVETDDRLDGPEVVLAATEDEGFFPFLPALYDPYTPESGEPDEGSWCHDRSCEAVPNSFLWRVTCLYSTKLDRPDLQQQVSPEARPPELDYDVITRSIPLLYDINDEAILNSAGDLFDPPLEDEESLLLIRISRNYLAGDGTAEGWNPLEWAQYKNKTNSEEFIGIKKYQAKCRAVRGNQFFEDGRYFIRVTIELEVGFRVMPDNVVWPNGGEFTDDESQSTTWVRLVLDRGYRQIIQPPFVDAGKRTAILDPQWKTALSTPGLLDGEGRQLPPADAPVFLAFDTLQSMDFNDLELFAE